MAETSLVAALRQSADPKAVDEIEQLIEHGDDRDLNRINVLAFAAKHGLNTQERIAAHAPDELSPTEFYRQMFWSSGVDLPDNLEARIADLTLDLVELPAGEKAFLSLQLPHELVIIFDPVTHVTQFIEVKGEPTHERQNLSIVISSGGAANETLTLRPGPLRLSLQNRTDRRVLPGLWIAGTALDDLL